LGPLFPNRPFPPLRFPFYEPPPRLAPFCSISQPSPICFLAFIGLFSVFFPPCCFGVRFLGFLRFLSANVCVMFLPWPQTVFLAEHQMRNFSRHVFFFFCPRGQPPRLSPLLESRFMFTFIRFSGAFFFLAPLYAFLALASGPNLGPVGSNFFFKDIPVSLSALEPPSPP